ncbi:ParB/RepB/Spo0J family partition protein [Candidatus Kaiserbacteria bacterium]|nr:ParB/RepB/Spo0J family partition protein [Candidatus Kaiserbacteria bacterium]
MTDDSQHYYSNSIFWVEVDRIKPNPYQPRRTFDDAALASLADSIRQYGVLQPLTVTRKEIERPGEGIFVEYELIAGERRLRASKLAGITQVPVVIRSHEETDKMKLELAIIENLQREDLNPIDRAKAFQKLTEEFNMTHDDVGKKVGKSRVYVTNTLRILGLPEDMQQALADGGIMEGHTRPLLMLVDRPEEQRVLFKEIIQKKTTVREAEQIARRIAVERARKFDLPPELLSIEKQLTEKLGTRVRIEKKEQGGKVLIDFFSSDDLNVLLTMLAARQEEAQKSAPKSEELASDPDASFKDSDDDLYSVKNFTV